jgi:type I restriction enzyme, S subunit
VSEETARGELPEGWTQTTLDKIASDVSYGYTAKSNRTSGEAKMLRITDIQDNRVDWNEVPYCSISPSDKSRYLLKKWDLVFARTGATVGKSFLIQEDIPDSVFASYLIRVRCLNHGMTQYLSYFFRSPSYWDQITDFSAGIGQPNVNGTKLKALEIPLAPLAEQKRIAEKLDAVLARVGACRARLDRVSTLVNRFRQSVLASATSGQLTEEWRKNNPNKVKANGLAKSLRDCHAVAGGHKTGNAAAPTEDVHDLVSDMFPEGWEIVTLRELVLPDRPITYGILMPGPELEHGVPYVRVADFPNNVVNLKTIRKTSKKMDEQFKRSRLRTGDLLMSIRGTVGRLIVIPPELENANITQDTARLTIQPEVNREYVRWYLNSTMAQSRMAAATKGVAVRGINIGDVRALQVPLPSREEQREIVRRVEALFVCADRIEARLISARKIVEQLTPAILAKAFRGELVPQDPKDEPAIMLLERIRAERALSPQSKTRKAPTTEVTVRPRILKQTTAMTKSRFDDDVKGQPYLANLLRSATDALSADDLFKNSELPLADFYKQLAWEVKNGFIRDDQSKLEAA